VDFNTRLEQLLQKVVNETDPVKYDELGAGWWKTSDVNLPRACDAAAGAFLDDGRAAKPVELFPEEILHCGNQAIGRPGDVSPIDRFRVADRPRTGETKVHSIEAVLKGALWIDLRWPRES
jgi:hypothetical protein